MNCSTYFTDSSFSFSTLVSQLWKLFIYLAFCCLHQLCSLINFAASTLLFASTLLKKANNITEKYIRELFRELIKPAKNK